MHNVMAILHYLLYLDMVNVDMYGTICVINTSARTQLANLGALHDLPISCSITGTIRQTKPILL